MFSLFQGPDHYLTNMEATGMLDDYSFEDGVLDLKVETMEVWVNPVEPHTCEQCGKTYDGLASYEVHLETKHGVSATIGCANRNHTNELQKTFLNGENCTKRINDTHNNYNVKCVPDLKKLMKTSKRKEPLKCDSCRYSCNDQNNFKRHVMIHTGEKPYKCDFCEYGCNTKSNLKKHMMKHTDEKPYKCDICDNRCITKSDLKVHMRTHTGEKPYTCDICDYSCSTKSYLKQHAMTHTGEKPYKCDICEYGSITNRNLKQHMMTY